MGERGTGRLGITDECGRRKIQMEYNIEQPKSSNINKRGSHSTRNKLF